MSGDRAPATDGGGLRTTGDERRLLGRGLSLVALLCAGLVVAGLAYTVAHAASVERSRLAREFTGRVALSASTTGQLLATSQKQTSAQAESLLAGPPNGIGKALKVYAAGSPPNEPSIVYGAGGAVLAELPAGTLGRRLAGDGAIRRALAGAGGFTDVFQGPGQMPMFATVAPYRALGGWRVLVNAGPLSLVTDIVAGYLRTGPGVPGARAYIVDGHGVIVAGTGTERPGQLIADHRLRAELARTNQGEVSGRRFAARPIGGGSSWRVVFVTTTRQLYGPLASGIHSSWVLFGFMTTAVLGVLALLAFGVRRSAALVRSEARADAAEVLAYERLHDELTGLPNRNLFLDRLEVALVTAGRQPGIVAVLLIDLDRFTRVNDSLGHTLGDDLLRAIAARLSTALHDTDTVSRFGGDEFMVLAPNVFDERHAVLLAERLQATIGEPIQLDGHEVHMTASIGIALDPGGEDAGDPGTVIRNADTAMYRAKSSPGNHIQVFDDELHRRAAGRLATEVALREAITGGRLVLHYQPIVELPGRTIRGAEALIRWDRGDGGLVMPGEFIGVAEESGLIVPTGEWVLGRACADLAAWRADGLVPDDFVLSVNLSSRQLEAPGLPALVAGILDRAGCPPRSLCLEITETAVLSQLEGAAGTLAELKAVGVLIAVDDFGTGYSSLTHVTRLPIDELKVDQSFTRHLDREREVAIVSAVATLAGRLGLLGVAEGIETEAQAERVTELGYTLGQGFLFARPEPEEAFRTRLRQAADPEGLARV